MHAPHRFFLDVTGDHDDLRLQSFGAQGAQYLIAIHLRHGQVEQHHLPQTPAYGLHCLATITRLGDRNRPVRRQCP
jgi:hypothetical protein